MTTDVFRVLHTADWHLGKTLHDQDRYDEHDRFLKFLLETIVAKDIHALIIAGDIFDSTNPPPLALRLYYEFLASVYHTTGCAVVVTSGNHDSPAHLEAPKDVLKALNIHVVGTIPKNLKDVLVFLPNAENPKIAIAALPFLRDRDLRIGQMGQSQDEIRKNIQEGIRNRYQEIAESAKAYQVKGVALIATGHLTVLGSSKSESERDNIHIGGLGHVTTDVFPDLFSYVALGHLHRPQNVGQNERFRYSGSPIPLSFSELSDKKEIRLLEFLDGELTLNEQIAIPQVRQLFQLKTTQHELEDALNNFNPEAGVLPHFVELIIKTDQSHRHLQESIEKYTLGKTYKVIKTVVDESITADGLKGDESLNIHSLGDLLGNPVDVFNQRLREAPDLSEEDQLQLPVAFAELYDLVLEDQRQSFNS